MGNPERNESIPRHGYPSLWMKKLYAWVLHWVNTPYSVLALFLVGFAGSSFSPVPPDILLMAMALARPAAAFYYAFICSLGSVAGGLFGYFVGYFLWEAVDQWFIPHVFSREMFDLVRQKYELHSFWIVFTAAFSPIPYKVFTIAAGVCGISLPGFIIASTVGRALRFFILSAMLFFFGAPIKKIIARCFGLLTIAFTALLILGFMLIKKLF